MHTASHDMTNDNTDVYKAHTSVATGQSFTSTQASLKFSKPSQYSSLNAIMICLYFTEADF